MLRTVAADPTGEDALWAEARSLLDRAPTESAEQRLGRWRRTRVLAVVAVLLSGTAVVLVVAVLFRDALGERPAVDVPSWRAAAGFGLAGAGLLDSPLGSRARPGVVGNLGRTPPSPPGAGPGTGPAGPAGAREAQAVSALALTA
jgi:hypothetical protein